MNGKWIIPNTQNQGLYWTSLSNLIWYFFTSSASYHEEVSGKTTITSSDDSENNYKRKRSSSHRKYKQLFERQSLVLLSMPEDLFLFLMTRIKQWLFGKLHLCPSIWTHTSPICPSRLHSLSALPVAVLAIPANSTARANHAKSAKHIVDYLSRVFFLTCTHMHQMQRCVWNPFVVRRCGPTTGPRAACVPPQRFQWPAEAFRKNLQMWNLLKNVWGYICLTELLALDEGHLHKNNEYYLFCAIFCLICLFYDQIKRYGLPLTFRWGTWLDNLCVLSVPRRSLSWRVHLAQWTQYQQINLSTYPLNAAISKRPSSQINCPSVQ